MGLKESKCRFNLSIEKEMLEYLKGLAETDYGRSCNSLIIRLITLGLQSEEMQPLIEKLEQAQNTEK